MKQKIQKAFRQEETTLTLDLRTPPPPPPQPLDNMKDSGNEAYK